VVYGKPGHDAGKPAARVVDLVRPLAPPRPAVGHDVLGVGPARGESVGDAVQVRPQLGEDRRGFIRAHSSLLLNQTTQGR
jgi:hypothetical protein